MKEPRGLCSLVGAGPGDPGLMTLRARDRLERADVIIHDHLIDPAVLRWAPSHAEIICAGKRPGAPRISQEEINRLLVEKTAAGLRVVRLKGGDPFLFGRGGEEAEALATASLPYEIVPGISSALAAPAYAGIPLTHRDHASEVTIFTGHEDPGKPAPSVNYGEIGTRPGTKVMLMGLDRLGAITAAMLASGADPATPVALVQEATTGAQRAVRGSLADIAARAAAAQLSAPVVAVFGDVANSQLPWFESRPLFGKRIVVTRTRHQGGKLRTALQDLGADVFELPTIRIAPPTDIRAFAELVQDAHLYDWILFTSANGVDAFFEMFYKLYSDAREIGGARIAAIGPATSERIAAFHLKVDLQPSDHIAEGMVAAFDKEYGVENLRILVVAGESARDLLANQLTQRGAIVDVAMAYRTLPETSENVPRLDTAQTWDLVTFTSASTVENFAAMQLPLPPTLRTASIGPITSNALRAKGFAVDIEARDHDIPGLVTAIQEFFAPDRNG
jgi:uroporphyrinogen III methyltransferase/synthase